MIQIQSYGTVEPNQYAPLMVNVNLGAFIYKHTVSALINPDIVYLGTAEGQFKKRYQIHTKSFRD